MVAGETGETGERGDEQAESEVVVPPPHHRLYPRTIGGACYIVILILATTAIVVATVDDWRLGMRILALTLAGAGTLRLVLRTHDAGMLAVRHRALDVLLLGAVAVALWLLAGSIPDQPPL